MLKFILLGISCVAFIIFICFKHFEAHPTERKIDIDVDIQDINPN